MRLSLRRVVTALCVLPLTACTPFLALLLHAGQGSSEGGTISFGQSVSGDTSHTSDNYDPSCTSNSDANDQTWLFVPPATTRYQVSVTGDYDNVVYVLAGSGSGSELACNDDTNGRNARVVVELQAGQTYTVVVDGYHDASGPYTLDIVRADATTTPPPGADGGVPEPPEQEPGALTASVRVNGSTANATDHATPSCGAQAGSPDDEWTFVPTATDVYRVRTSGQFDTLVAVLDAHRTEIACNDDSLGTRDAMVEVQMTAGQHYFIVVDGYGGQLGAYGLIVEPVTGTPIPTRVGIGGVLTLGQRIVGSTLSAPDTTTPVCGGSADGTGDNVWTFTTRQAGLHRMRADGNFATVLELRDGDRAIACVASGVASRPAEIVAVLAAGQEYRVVVDGGPGQEGTFGLVVDDRVARGTRPTPTLPGAIIGPPPPVVAENAADMARACAAATPLRPGRTRGAVDPAIGTAVVTCARHIASGDVVYRLVLTRRAHVRVRETSDFDAVLELRRACTADGAVVCVDDAPDTRRTAVEADLEAGAYFVVVDTVSPGTGGPFTLDVDVR